MKIIKNNNLFNANKIVLINYANSKFKKSQNKNIKSAIKLNFFNEIISYSPKDIDKTFFNENKDILNSEKGNGYWLWKPYFIKKTLESLNDGDFLFYCDSGSYFKQSFEKVINSSILIKQDIIPFELNHLERFWTKRDAFILMDCDSKKYFNTKLRLAGFSLWRKSDFSIQFLDEWLSFSKDKRIITDIENELKFSNYSGFKEHRHDQSIFSLLTKKYNLIGFRDPSQFGNFSKKEYSNSNYNQFIELTRKRNVKNIDKINKILRRIKNRILFLLNKYNKLILNNNKQDI